MGTRITHGPKDNVAALRNALRERGYQYRSEGDTLFSDAPPLTVLNILIDLKSRGFSDIDFSSGTIDKAAWEKWPWFVNFTQGYNPPRRYSVPVPSLAIANAWENKYQSFGDRRRISVSQKPSKGATILPPNTSAP